MELVDLDGLEAGDVAEVGLSQVLGDLVHQHCVRPKDIIALLITMSKIYYNGRGTIKFFEILLWLPLLPSSSPLPPPQKKKKTKKQGNTLGNSQGRYFLF